MNAGTYTPTDPSTWAWSAASTFIVAADLGIMVDHSVIITAGCGPQANHAVGVVNIKQFPLGTPMEEVADGIKDEMIKHPGSRAIIDQTNNSAFSSVLAARLGKNPGNRMIAALLTTAENHALEPQSMPVSLGGVRALIPRWTLSKAEAGETVEAELTNKTLRIAKVGDWRVLRDELQTMEREVRKSGSVAYSAPDGKHDDTVTALALAVFGADALAVDVDDIQARDERCPWGRGPKETSAIRLQGLAALACGERSPLR
jgi:hypothetical protein